MYALQRTGSFAQREAEVMYGIANAINPAGYEKHEDNLFSKLIPEMQSACTAKGCISISHTIEELEINSKTLIVNL